MKREFITTFGPGFFAFVLLGAVGWQWAAPSPDGGNHKPATNEPPQRDYRKARTMATRDRSAIDQQMRAIRSGGTSADRMRATIALANSVPPSEFAAWVEGDRFDFRKGPELSVFRMMIFERWIKEDPDSLIPWAAKNNYGQAGRALASLAADDPQKLIEHYRLHPDPKLELETLGQIVKNHPELALQRLEEISAGGLSSSTDRDIKLLLDTLAQKSPDLLQAALDRLPANLQQQAETALIGQRLLTSYSTEVRALWDRPDGWQIFSESAMGSDKVAASLVDDLANLPSSWRAGLAENPYYFVGQANAKKWFDTDLEAVGFTAKQSQFIRNQALSRIAFSDPEFALKNLAGPDIDAGTKTNIISNAFREAKGDHDETEKLIGLIGSEADKQIARDQLKITELANNSSAERMPKQWLASVGGLSGAADHSYQLLDQIRKWDKTKLTELRDGFNNLPPDQQQNIARVVAAGGVSSNIDAGFAGDAIRSLVNNPPPKTEDWTLNPATVSSRYAVQLSNTDPIAATTWISSLPDGDAKLWAMKNVAANWNQYDPKAVTEWTKTLPPDSREKVISHLKTKK